MIKVAIIADSIDTQRAGIHVYTRNMIEALRQSDKIEVTCFRIKDNPEHQLPNPVVVRPLHPFLLKDPLRLFFKLPRAIRKINPDIVIEPAHFGPFNLPGKIKRVTVIHDLTPILFPQWHNRLSSTLQRIFFPSIVRKASLLMTNSNNTSNDLLKCYPGAKGKTMRIYPSVDPFYLIPPEEITTEKQPFFLSVGTIEPRKNLTTLLDAYQLFRDQTGQNYSLVICGGDGWKNKDFQVKLNNHPYRNDIQLKGYVSKEELKKLYDTTAAFVYPSLYEGFGFPVAEAMGCGAPCIVSNRSSLPEAGGSGAIYFNPENIEELAEKLNQIVTDKTELANQLKTNHTHALSFSTKQFSVELENVLTTLK